MKKDTAKKSKKAETKTTDVKTHPLIKGLRMTEKSALGADRGVYTFNVADNATKNEIKKAIKTLYSVLPVKVAITQIQKKPVFRRGIRGTKSGGKKVVVYLKKGDKITFA